MHMKRTTIWLNADHTRQLAVMYGKADRTAPSAQLIRVAIAQFLSRERRSGRPPRYCAWAQRRRQSGPRRIRHRTSFPKKALAAHLEQGGWHRFQQF